MLRGAHTGFYKMKVILPASQLHEAFYAMGLLHSIPGGPHHIYFPLNESAARDKFDDIVDLASRMSWVRTVQRGLPPLNQYGLDLRPYPQKQTNRAMLTKMRYFCGIYESKPWFERMESKGAHVVLSRSLRQHNPLFPWHELLTELHPFGLKFVGSDEEFEAFKLFIPPRVRVDKLTLDWSEEALDACLSAVLYVGNHTPAQAITEGAHIPSIIEVSLSDPDNIYLRDGVYPGFSHRVDIPESVPFVGGITVQKSVNDFFINTDMNWSPPRKGWRVDVIDRSPRYFADINEAAYYRCRRDPDYVLSDLAYARHTILCDNLVSYPEWAEEALAERLFRKPALALRAATRKLKLRNFIPPISNYVSSLCD